MVFPTLEKTWKFSVNNVCGTSRDTVTDGRDLLFKILNAYLAMGWTMRSSSDSVTFGNEDGVNRILTKENLVFNGSGNKSWFVIQNSSVAPKAALEFDCGYSSSYAIFTVYFSAAGFGTANGGADGNLTTRPTAAAASQISMGTNGMSPSGSGHRSTFHLIQSTDNEVSRLIVTDAIATSGAVVSYLAVEKVKSPAPEWDPPVFVHYWDYYNFVSNGWRLVPANLVNGTAGKYAKVGGTSLTLHFTGRGRGGVLLTNQSEVGASPLLMSDDPAEGWPLLPIGIACTTTGHRNWRKGMLYDAWFGSNQLVTGTFYPSTPGQQRKLMQFNQLVLPWDGLVTPDGTPIDLG